jgi:hypothetical protein
MNRKIPQWQTQHREMRVPSSLAVSINVKEQQCLPQVMLSTFTIALRLSSGIITIIRQVSTM